MEEKIKDKLNELRGALQADGGDIELVALQEKRVQVRLRGACGGCPHAVITLKNYIEQALRKAIDPELVVERVA